MVLHGLKDKGFNGERNCVVFYDFGTEYHDALPVSSRKEAPTDWAFRQWVGPEESLNKFYSDRAPERQS